MNRLCAIFTATACLLACTAALAANGFAAGSAQAHAGWSEQLVARAASTHVRTSTRVRLHASNRRKLNRRRSAAKRTSHRKAHAPRSATLRAERKTAAVDRGGDETRAVTIARVLATPCQNAQLTPEPANLQLAREAVLCLINTVRAEHDETPLAPNAQLERAAEEHGQEMIALNYFDHVAPNGLTPVGRISATGYIPSGEVGYVIGENLAWGTLTLATPQAIVNAWVASPGHLANILEDKYRDTGISVLPAVPASLAEGAAGATYTQEFGVIVH